MQGVTRLVGVHLVLSQRERDVIVCRYKGDSKSEQMAFIVDHRPRRPFANVPIVQKYAKNMHRHYHGRFALRQCRVREFKK